jgi:glycosyltransferase involved in cell wall biosynthesis
VLSRLPVAVTADQSKAGSEAVGAELCRQPEVVVADFPHATVLFPDDCATPSVLFTHNVEAEIFRRHADVAANAALKWLWRDQARKMQRFEDRAARCFDGVVTVSERDARHFGVLCGQERVHAIPTGVDLDYFTFHPRRAEVPHDGGTLVFTGSMNWRANIDGIRYFMDSVWPVITALRPRTRMIVVGHSPPPELTRAAAERNLAWTFTGFVDDIRVHVREADIYVIPLRVGGGTRIKAFEAMAMGCPIVSTAVGMEGLPVTAGSNFAVAEGPQAFAQAIDRLLSDGASRSAMAHNGRVLVQERYSHLAAASAFEEACLRTIASKRPGTTERAGIGSTALATGVSR